MAAASEEREHHVHRTSVDIGAGDKPLGLLGSVDTLEPEVDIESDLAEIRAGVDKSESVGTSESTYTWAYENGRRYASSELGHYYIPNDEPEIQRLNEQHWVLTQVKGGGLHFAPLPDKEGLRILDVGCGSGIWCIQVAEASPKASIFGMDVSPIQPKQKPVNVSWVTQDMEGDWPFPDDYFDLVHLSLVHGCVADWDKLLTKIKRHLVPGGYVEHQEYSLCRQYVHDENDKPVSMPDKLRELTPFFQWTRLMGEAGEARGRAVELGPHLRSMQTKAGFQRVTEKVIPHKWGSWPSDPRERELGTRTMLQAVDGMDGFTTVMFTKSLGWSLEDTQKFIGDVKKDMRDDRLRKVMDLHIVYGQKPAQPPRKAVEEPKDGSGVSAALVEGPGLQLGTLVVATIGASFAAAFVHWLQFAKRLE